MDNENDDAQAIRLMNKAIENARGYADFFDWPLDRSSDLQEWGVLNSFVESLEQTSVLFFSNHRVRGNPYDPPDCDAVSVDGQRLAIEITELVDRPAIENLKRAEGCRGGFPYRYRWADWPREKFLMCVAERLQAKASRFPELIDAPYPGGYVVLIHTDEPLLPRRTVADYLSGYQFQIPPQVDRAFLLLSYDAAVKHCPCFELSFKTVARKDSGSR